ncbi:hypothetical protein L1049_010268 [Liquidambar formosana]|uniref:Ubiquitin-like domain-containing protein n=1 Tax=Liquidambar formosana TaxID=63359 RepID=A0AAP0N903_LIQFO
MDYQDPMPTINIIIVYEGVEYPLITMPNASIMEVKCLIEELFGIPYGQQTLWFNEHFLRNEYRLPHYQITQGDRLQLQRGIPMIIRTSAGEQLLTLRDTTKVRELKEIIFNRVDSSITVERMVLKVGDRTMDDRCGLWLYDIIPGTEIFVTS